VLSVSSLFLTQVGVSVGVCVCTTHTHTHTAQMGYLKGEPRSRDKTPGGPKNPDGLNLAIYLFVYVYNVHICMYMLRGGMRSWTTAFFFNTFFLPKKKSKRSERKPLIISNLTF